MIRFIWDLAYYKNTSSIKHENVEDIIDRIARFHFEELSISILISDTNTSICMHGIWNILTDTFLQRHQVMNSFLNFEAETMPPRFHLKSFVPKNNP